MCTVDRKIGILEKYHDFNISFNLKYKDIPNMKLVIF